MNHMQNHIKQTRKGKPWFQLCVTGCEIWGVNSKNYECTVNATGETMVLSKYFPTKNKGFFQPKAGKVGKIGISPA